MKTRILTALGIILCVIPPLVFGGWLMALLIGFIICAGAVEWLSLKHSNTPLPIFPKLLAIACVVGLLFLEDSYISSALAVICLLFLSIPVFTDEFTATDSFLCITYVVFFYTVARAVIHIYTSDALLVWYIIIATYGTDTGAYFCGRFFGKHKLNERISPKKTIEGSIGGCIMGIVLSFAFAYFMLPKPSTTAMLIGSIVMSITGQIGDLAFSAIKRNFKIKDFSDLLPGHGGVLDRVDSLLFNFVCFYMVMVVFML